MIVAFPGFIHLYFFIDSFNNTTKLYDLSISLDMFIDLGLDHKSLGMELLFCSN